jgi:hypothetical protein
MPTPIGPRPFGTQPSQLDQTPDLFIDVSDDANSLNLFRVPDRTPLGNPNNLQIKDLEHLTSIPSCGLLYPDVHIARTVEQTLCTKLITLYGRGRRITRAHGVSVDWDAAIDRRVWTTNIDTVLFIAALERLGIFDDTSLKNIVEVGVGGGHITATFANRMPWLSALFFTDISPTALQCALRNVSYQLAGFKPHVFPYLGKGIRHLPGMHDLLICNPPYIPIAPHQFQDETDPYRGTGLLKELITMGHKKTKRLIFSVSSMAMNDVRQYAKEAGKQLKVHETSHEIPLKIENIDHEWAQWLVNAGLLEERDYQQYHYRYWHRLHTIEVLS